MAMYNGLLIRDNRWDKGRIPSAGSPTFSPDIICYQESLLTPKDAAITYNSYICKHFLQDSVNNIYIRAKNLSDRTLAGKVKAYYAPLNMMYMPPRWTPMYANGKLEVELIDMSYSTGNEKDYAGVLPGEVACTKEAFNLVGVADPNEHHCMMGLATSPDGSYITLPESFPGGDNELWAFLSNNPQIAYNNIVIEQPYSHTIMKNVDIGNLDGFTRKYVMCVNVLEGEDTLKDTVLLLQSTDQSCPFSYKMTMDGQQTCYSFPETDLPADYSGTLNFAMTMQDYQQAEAVLCVENYAVNMREDIMIPNASVVHANRTFKPRKATKLGDFYIYLGKYRNGEGQAFGQDDSAQGKQTAQTGYPTWKAHVTQVGQTAETQKEKLLVIYD